MKLAPRWLWLPTLFAAGLALTPLIYIALRVSEGWQVALAEITRPRTFELLVNSLLLTAAVTLSAVLLATAQAWVASRASQRQSQVISLLSVLPLALPSYVAALGWVSSFPSASGLLPAWLVLTVGTAPYVFLATYAALQTSDWAAEDAARSLGASEWRVFARVTWPGIRTSVTLSAILVALYVLAEFGALAFLRFETFTVAIYNAYRSSFDRTAAATLSLVLALIALGVIAIEARYRSRARQTVSRPNRLAPSRAIPKLRIWIVTIPSIIAVLGPVLSLLRWSILGSSRAPLGELLQAAVTSLALAIAAALLIGIFAIAFSLVIQRRAGRLSRLADRVVWVSHSLPAIVIALAIVFLSSRYLPSWYQTLPLLLLGYLILLLPNAIAGMSATLLQVSSRVEEAAQTIGVAGWDVLRRVTLPLARPGIFAAVALVSIAVFRELPLTLLLRPTGLDTLATEIWTATSVGSFAAAAPYGIVMVLLAGIPSVLLHWQSQRLVRGSS